MITDYHTHVLPGIDDGSKDAETSLEMLIQLKEQGIERVIATPHFYFNSLSIITKKPHCHKILDKNYKKPAQIPCS